MFKGMSMSFWREVFSEGGQGSFSRVASGFHTAGALAWISHFVMHTHSLPDATTLTGLAAFVISPYGASKVSGAISSFGSNGASKP